MTRNHALQVGYFSLHSLSRWGRGCLGVVCPGGGVSMGVSRGKCVQGGCVSGWWVYVFMGVCPGGSVCQEVYTPSTQRQTPPSPVNRMADRCKNITLPQTLFAGGRS